MSRFEMAPMARQIAQGTATAEAVVRACLDRIAAAEPDLQAWQFLDPAAAIATARALYRGPHRGMLHGVPVAVKDVIDTVDMPTTYGSPLYAGHRPASDAACVAIARSKGAVMLGKTVSTEFAFLSPGKTRNPYHAGHTPGGSSSGSAAAVGRGTVPLAFGTQTSGSIIRPASFCGAVGYKPSFGMIDRTGVKTLATSFDTVGVFAGDVADAAFLAAAVADRPGLAAVTPLTQLRVGLCRTSAWDRLEPASIAAMARAQATLGGAGAVFQDVAVDYGHYLALHDAVMDWDVLNAFSFERLFHRDRLTERTRVQIAEFESRVSLAAYEAACVGMAQARAAWPDVLGDCDVMLVPAAPGEAPAGLASTGDPTFNRGWTLLNVPCVTVPAGEGPGGLPVGVQVVGRLGEDARTLAAAAAVEAALR